jgi:hypothetical protein
MSKRIFKVLSTLVIFSMLVMAVGVIPALAAPGPGWQTDRADVANTATPFYKAAVDLVAAGANVGGDLGGCSVAPSFGKYQTHLLESDPAGLTTYLYARVRVVSNVDKITSSWGIRISRDDTMAELGCQMNNADGIVDLVVAVPVTHGFVVTLASNGIFVPTDTSYQTWVFPTLNAGGGIIVDMSVDAASYPDRFVEASGATKAYKADVTVDDMAFLDVPTGTYNLGIQDQTPEQELAVYVDKVTATYIALNPGNKLAPNWLATQAVTVTIEDELGIPLDLQVAVNTNASLLLDLEVGWSGFAHTPMGIDLPGVKTFMVNPGPWGWDVTAYIDQAPSVGPDYFLVKRDINTVGGDVDFRLDTVLHQKIHLCYPGADALEFHYLNAWLLGLDPAGNLMPRDFDFTTQVPCTGPTCPCAGGPNVGGDLILSGGTMGKMPDQPVSYSGMQVCLEADPAAKNQPGCGPRHDKMPTEFAKVVGAGVLALADGCYVSAAGTTICPPVAPCGLDKVNWLYYFVPTVNVWDFAGSIGVHLKPNYASIFGETPFITTVATSAVNTDAPGTVTLTRGIWTDQFGNIIVRILGPDMDCADDETGGMGFISPILNDGIYGLDSFWFDDVFPVDTLVYGVKSVKTVLADDSWATTSFTVASKIGRYDYVRSLWHGKLPNFKSLITCCDPWPAGLCPGYFQSDVQFAINPKDVHYGADWAYHFIMTNYEVGLTGGMTATTYKPYLNVNRGMMAAFLANGFVKLAGQTLPAYGGAFTDVYSTDYFAASVQYIKNLHITGGVGGGLYAPASPVIRGDMAIFIEKTGQAISTFPVFMAWNPALGTPLFYAGHWYPNDPGIYNGWFTDVPASAYYATMAEEALADRLTGGCYPGTPYLDLKFCPTKIVDRSEMAVFLGRTWSLLEAPAWWTLTAVPAPQN